MPLLEVTNLNVTYGVQRALNDVSLTVNEGEIVVMIGPNGAGKSSTIKAVGGILAHAGGRIENGDIIFRGKNIKGRRTDELVKLGISFVHDTHRVFPSMTVLENLEMGGYTLSGNAAVQRKIDEVIALFPRLGERKKQAAGTLSIGEQQMLAIGRSLMLTPALLLVDEPSIGLSPNFVETIFSRFVEINRGGTALLIVEQNTRKALELCHRGYVFEIGRIAMEGTHHDLLENRHIRSIYLGE
ncbi:MAG: ABC transporter ATP-binding protein [Chitinispirillaceae bacterium]|nr:ABC transporter ATP-binding protein [Chitinispirillaceae bacterium]